MKQTIKSRKEDIIYIFETEYHFRDYTFLPASKFGKVGGIKASIHLLNPTNRMLQQALEMFTRDGYSTIVVYLNK